MINLPELIIRKTLVAIFMEHRQQIGIYLWVEKYCSIASFILFYRKIA